MLVFTHIPRTAGTSIRAYISQRIQRFKFIDGFSELSFMNDEEINKFDFIATHCGYGLFNRIRKDHKKLIILREPVERILSHYYYLRELKDNVSYSSHYAKNLSVEDFIMEENPAVSVAIENTQTWHLLDDKNLHFRNRHKKLSDQQKIDIALQNLEKYDFVGFTDRIGGLFTTLCNFYGWPIGPFPHLAQSNKRSGSNVDRSVIEKINAKVALDLVLYRKADQKYGTRQLAPSPPLTDFKA